MSILSDSFFEIPAGFIEEFWVSPQYRSRGIGTQLLACAETYLQQNGAALSVLTSDTAEEFYLLRGYHKAQSACAKNKAPVFLKVLQP